MIAARWMLLAFLVTTGLQAQPASTRCSATEVAVPGTRITDLQLIGCGEGFPDNLLWHLDRADSLSGALDGMVTRRATGKGAVIYMIDTGVMQSHDEFTRADGSNVIGAITLNGPSTRCGKDRDPALDPCFAIDADLIIYGHGTATASVAAGRTTGVAPDAKIVSVYVGAAETDIDRWLATFDLIIRHAFDPRTPAFNTAIINMSASPKLASPADPKFPAFERKMRDMIAGVDAAGNRDDHGKRFLFVSVAGNFADGPANQCNADMTTNIYPATLGSSIDGLITAGGIDQKSGVWERSCRGAAVDILAPAQGMLVASISGHDHYRSGKLVGGYPLNDGTSYSGPYISGLAALLLEEHPDLTPPEIERMLKRSPSLATHVFDATANGKIGVFDWVTTPSRHRAAKP